MTPEKFKLILRNRDVNSILMGTPKGHSHIRAIMETRYGTFIFQEATIANLVRAYITLKTHPRTRSLKLTLKEMNDEGEAKPGFAKFQLLEQETDTAEIQEEIDKLCP
ncbi:MAG: hypothetical protein ACP5K1_04815 [Candidatus Bathyarchaeia archaeon]